MYVGSQSGLSTTELGKDPCSEHRYTQAPRSRSPEQLRKDRRAAASARLRAAGARRGGGRGGGGRGAGAVAGNVVSYKDASPGTTTIAGVSILKPRELGGITAYNMNTGDKVWWIPERRPNEASQPSMRRSRRRALCERDAADGLERTRSAAGDHTRTLVIYGTGRMAAARRREGMLPQLYALDKATGKQVAAVSIPGLTSAVPMTFMHNKKQYIVFATGGGKTTELIALALPN